MIRSTVICLLAALALAPPASAGWGIRIPPSLRYHARHHHHHKPKAIIIIGTPYREAYTPPAPTVAASVPVPAEACTPFDSSGESADDMGEPQTPEDIYNEEHAAYGPEGPDEADPEDTGEVWSPC